jgi:uncharacterized membrane protein SpoIIM required for sporulation/ABC-type transport system involved in multi-copper enzyme maturation permease subunit
MFETLRLTLVITKRELHDHFRDWRIMGPIFLLVVILPWFMNYASGRLLGFTEKYGARIANDQIYPFLLMVVGFFPITVALVIALESFVGEKERRSLEPLLNTPLSDTQIFLGKLLAACVPPLIASFLGMAAYLIIIYWQGVWFPNTTMLIQVFALAAVNSIVMVSGAVVVSSQTTSLRAANLISVFIILPMAVLLQGQSAVIVWADSSILWLAVIGEIVIAALLIRTGISHFNREELIGRELDTLNLRYGLESFWYSFIGNATSLKDWYRGELKQTLVKLRVPIILVALILLGGMLIGASLSNQFVIPGELFDLSALKNGSLQGMESVQFFDSSSVPVVWFHNLRTIILATIAGVFSFGVLAMIILMTPLLLIGFFTATISHAGISPVLFLLAFVVPHGILEVPAILLSGAAILYLGARLAAPASGKTIGETWLVAMADWSRVMVGLVLPLLLGAALLEVLVTPRLAQLLFGS